MLQRVIEVGNYCYLTTIKSTEQEASKYHQRKISFTSCIFFKSRMLSTDGVELDSNKLKVEV